MSKLNVPTARLWPRLWVALTALSAAGCTDEGGISCPHGEVGCACAAEVSCHDAEALCLSGVCVVPPPQADCDGVDRDGDGVLDCHDPCPDDLSDDSDGDGTCDGQDICADGADDADADRDGLPDACDSCPNNPTARCLSLSGLIVAQAAVVPEFSSEQSAYRAEVGLLCAAVDVAARAKSGVALQVKGKAASSGIGVHVPIGVGDTAVPVEASAAGETLHVHLSVQRASDFEHRAYLKASNTGSGDSFGANIALSGDTLAVGVPAESSDALGIGGVQTNDNAVMSGAVYVFARVGETWTQQAYLKAGNAQAGDAFGSSVALDGNTLVVGAPGEVGDGIYNTTTSSKLNENAADSGAAYVFARSSGRWTQQDYLKAIPAGPGDAFGTNVAVKGNTALIGAPGEDSSATGIDGNKADEGALSSGAAYVFTRTGSTYWSALAYLKANNTGAGDGFGTRVALTSGLAVVAAPGEDGPGTGTSGDAHSDGATDSGAVYAFSRAGTGWTFDAYLKASNTDAGDGFGKSLALQDDELVVGAPDEASRGGGNDPAPSDDTVWSAGAAHVFTRASGSWRSGAFLKAQFPKAGARFGSAVSVATDVLAIGAPGDSSAGVNGGADPLSHAAALSGAVHLFGRTERGFEQQAFLKPENSESSDAYGTALALSTDTLVVGAPGEDSGASGVGGRPSDNSVKDSGAVYVAR
jgi:hypothetical protein